MKIIQKPNLLLIIALTTFIISKLTEGLLHKFGATIYMVTIIIWAYQEITTGVNWFRKTLGVIILLTVSYSIFTKLT